LMFFFLVAYVAAIFIVSKSQLDILVILMGVVFLGGATFVLYVIKLGLDTLTNLKNVNIELQLQSENITKKSKELEQFTYFVSHDLKAPLLNIVALVNMMRHSQDGDAEAQRNIGFISSSVEQMTTLVSGLLEYNRIGKNRQLEEIDCTILLNKVIVDFSVKIQEVNANIILSQLPSITGYATELRQLFQNLLGNALKFQKPNVSPEIKISAKRQNEGWLFAVEDNGIGIDAKYKDEVFLIFQRLHSKTAYEGSGIGLANCKKIIEMHNGSIWMESSLGKGSTFFFTINN
jgi:light-regulated signal transduction histidine kinase (bacteriophytochrome)